MKRKKLIKGLIILALIFIVLSFFAPYLFTGKKLDFTKTGEIGDTIGGLMNPFIAISGVIITGLAFYMQYVSNKQVQKQFKNQQIESQIYEMIRLHKQNTDELSLEGFERQLDLPKENEYAPLPKYKLINTIISKKNVISVIVKEFEILLHIFKKLNGGEINQNVYNAAYQVFFFGFQEPINYNLPLAESFNNQPSDLYNMISKVREHIKRTMNISIEWDLDEKLQNEISNLKIDFARGHSDFLSHYFRHLFHTVKFIVSQDIKYEKKINYLRMLRAQLSNQEQALLFYNWLATDFGGKWEEDTINGNKYFTEYCMIHNLWYNRLFEDEFINEKIEYLKNKETKLRQGKMFEI